MRTFAARFPARHPSRRSAEEENEASAAKTIGAGRAEGPLATSGGVTASVGAAATSPGSAPPRRRFPFGKIDLNSPIGKKNSSQTWKKRSSFAGYGPQKSKSNPNVEREGRSLSPSSARIRKSEPKRSASDDLVTAERCFPTSSHTTASASLLPAVSPEPSSEIDGVPAPSLAQEEEEEDLQVVSIFRSRIEDAQSSFWNEDMCLKRANPIYDSDSDEEDDSLSSPFKRLRHTGEDDLDDSRDTEDEGRPRATLFNSEPAFFLPESSWNKSDKCQHELCWSSCVSDDSETGFSLPPASGFALSK